MNHALGAYRKPANTMTDYLTHESPDAFVDMTKRKPENDAHVECPKCLGYGGWHLRLNARGPGQHFNAGCMNCHGWGWVAKDSPDAKCVHDYKEARNVGRCLNVWKCQRAECGHEITVDSSD